MENSRYKFRVWNKKNNILSIATAFQYLNYNDAIIMQFTGLFDKNGKEIYEGDIIGWTFNDIPKNEIIFKEGCLGHLITNPWSEFIPINKERASSMLVEGNIFENPDLLK